MFKVANRRVRLGLLLLAGVLLTAALPAVAIGRPWLAPAAAPLGMECAATGSTISLETATGYISVPDGNSIWMWGYTLNGAAFQMPGPVLCVNQGDHVTITLTNNALTEPTSIVFPGQEGVTITGGTPGLFTAEAAPGGGVTYEFDADFPGTYLYESGTEPDKQVQMGLYGALIVRPSQVPANTEPYQSTNPADYAYDDAATEFDEEYLLVMHDIDPFLHQDVERGVVDYDVTTMEDHYWTINGRSFPDTISDSHVDWLPNQPYGSLVKVTAVETATLTSGNHFTLVRYINAGMVNHPFHPHGNQMLMIGRDGRQLATSFENFTTTAGSGQTYDLLWRWLDTEAWDKQDKPLPVLIPGIIPGTQNLVFKDDVSFFSGDPYLGEQGDFPVGVTVFNECGEFYFPWHSHALNEFTNYDEAFGGLATLVRVDPPGGCP